MIRFIVLVENKLPTFLKLARNYFSFLVHFSLQRKVKNKENKEKIAVLDFHTFGAERNYAQIIQFFSLNGYTIYLRHRFLFFANLKEFRREIATAENLHLFIGKKRPHKGIIYLFDKKSAEVSRQWPAIYISEEILSRKAGGGSEKSISYPMQPRYYFSKLHDKVYSLRNNQRSMKLFFSGNQNRQYYNGNKFKHFFPDKMSRVEIIDTLLHGLKEHEKLLLNNLEQVEKLDYENRFVLSQWERKSLKEVIPKRTSNEHWFDFLSLSDFFLACPGYIQPMCHNVIEAMSVGTIPVLEHPEMFTPPLKDGENCVAFKGKKDLLQKVRYVLGLQEETVHKMKTNVAKS